MDMEDTHIDDASTEGAQGLAGALSDPDWALLSEALGKAGSSTGLRFGLEEARARLRRARE